MSLSEPGETMRVRVLYFGVLKDVVGRDGEERELTGESTVGTLLGELEREAESSVWRSVAVAVNREYAVAGTVLGEGDEVALLPPVSGGRGAD
jgi:molybdopterin converting factor subunit 1